LDFDFLQRRNIFLFSIASRPIAGFPQPPVQDTVLVGVQYLFNELGEFPSRWSRGLKPRQSLRCVCSNPTRRMYICVRLICGSVVLCVGSGLATGCSPVQGVLPTVYRIAKQKKEASAQQRTVEPMMNELMSWVTVTFRLLVTLHS
jgi:hypothetical protein